MTFNQWIGRHGHVDRRLRLSLEAVWDRLIGNSLSDGEVARVLDDVLDDLSQHVADCVEEAICEIEDDPVASAFRRAMST